jgi:hypothetical protein
MADLERIKPPVPTLPTTIGRTVSNRRRQQEPRRKRDSDPESVPNPKPESDHIDEYV